MEKPGNQIVGEAGKVIHCHCGHKVNEDAFRVMVEGAINEGNQLEEVECVSCPECSGVDEYRFTTMVGET